MMASPKLPDHWIGLASDLEVAGPAVSVRAAGDCIAVHLPERRDFNDLNALWPRSAPSASDLPVLLETWREQFEGTGVQARVLCWEESGAQDPEGSPWAEGDRFGEFRLSRLEVLRCSRPAEVPRNGGLEVRPVESDDDWRQVVEMNVHVHGFDDEARATFCRWMIGQRHRGACESGRAGWWAAWSDGRPVASAGLYRAASGPARFQEVVTHPDFRRRGACTTLMSTMLETCGPEGSLLIADCGSDAHRIYSRLGFEPVSRIRELFERLPA